MEVLEFEGIQRTQGMTNVRHDIAPALVQDQIEKKVAGHELDRIRYKEDARIAINAYEKAKVEGTTAYWRRPPREPGDLDPLIDDRIQRERTYYALVRVIELPVVGNRFILVYGDVDDSTVTSGTGPFESFDAAASWFLKSGR